MDRSSLTFRAINHWQNQAGEDFLDYFDSSVNEVSFMFWCYGKGYISQERFNVWEEAYNNAGRFGHSLSEYLYNCYDEDNGFSVVYSDDWEQEKQDEAYTIIAEFISRSVTYQRRFFEFLRMDEEYEDW